MVPSKSISKEWTLLEDEGLDLRLTGRARDVGLGDSLICRSGPTVPRSSFSQPMRPPLLHVGVAEVGR